MASPRRRRGGGRLSRPRPPGAPGDEWNLAVVVDVVRAFTLAPWVLRQGASRLLPGRDAEAAVAARRDRFPHALLVKDGAPDPRFDLPNSPAVVATTALAGRTVVQATGNGTRGAHAVRRVSTVACASFVTAAATARVMARHRQVLLRPDGDLLRVVTA